MTDQTQQPAASLSDLPDDQLAQYGQNLGLHLEPGEPRGEMLRLIRRRQEVLLELDREALLDVVVWARRPVRRSASKEVLAKEIAQVRSMRFEGLSDRGLRALARLHGVEPQPDEPRDRLERRVKKAEGWRARIRRARRAVIGGLVARAIRAESADDYKFLPENEAASLRRDIEDQGVVTGIARKLRGVADDYVREKLDEIEARIDGKLDEIDQRLGEWRDREVRNRLRILKLTLAVSILVALLSLGYDWVSGQRGSEAGLEPPPSQATPADGGQTPTRQHQGGPQNGPGDDVREVQPTS